MAETHDQLAVRKRDLFAAVRALEQDREDGSVTDETYRSMRDRLEQQAAAVLEQLDSLAQDRPALVRSGGGARRRTRWTLTVATLALVLAAIGIFLTSALTQRAAGGTITGNGTVPTAGTVAQSPPAVRSAERLVARSPNDLAARIALGNALFQSGQIAAADASYRRAIILDPRRPEAPTLRATLLGYVGQRSDGLAILHQVERDHPGYARAWLVNGMLAAGKRGDRHEAISAWKRFLGLDPHGTVAAQVRVWIRQDTLRSGKPQ